MPLPSIPHRSGRALAVVALRLWLGCRALLAGIEKFAGKTTVEEPLLDATGQPDISGAVVIIERKVYGLSHYHAIPETLKTKFSAEPLLPDFLTTPFYFVLGPGLIILGLAVLLGLFLRLSLFLMGLLYTSLTIGLVLTNQDIGPLAIHLGLVAMTLAWSENKHPAPACS